MRMNTLLVLVCAIVVAASATAADRYWVGSGQNFSDTAGWSTVSNGSGGSSVPGSNDLAHFDAYSGNCTLSAVASVAGLDMIGYVATFTQNASLTIGSSGFSQSGGTFQGSTATLTVNGAFALNGGCFSAPSSTLAVTGNITIGSGTFTANSGTLLCNGGSKIFNTGTATFYNVTIQTGGNIYVTGTTNIAGTLTLLAQNAMIGGTFALSGDCVVRGTSCSSPMSTLLLFSGSADQSLNALGGSGLCPSVQIAKTGGTLYIRDTILAVGGSWTYTSGTVNASSSTVKFCGGDTTINSGYDATLMPFNNLTFNTGGNITIGSGGVAATGTVINQSSNAFLNGNLLVGGDLITTAPFLSAATSTFVFNGAGDQVLSASGQTGRLPNVSINKPAGTLHIQDNIMVESNLTLVSGVVDAGTSTVIFAGGNPNIDAEGLNFYNVTLNTAGNVTLAKPMTVGHTLTITAVNGLYGDIDALGDVVTTDTTIPGTGTVHFVGVGDQHLSANGGVGGLANLEIAKPSGTLYLADTIRLTGDWAHMIGTLSSGTSTIVLVQFSTNIFGDTRFNNLTIQKSYTSNSATLNDNVIVAGNLTLTSGTLVLADDKALSVAGDVAFTGGSNIAFAAAKSTVVLNGGSDQSVQFGGFGVNALRGSNTGGWLNLASGFNADTVTLDPGSRVRFAAGANYGVAHPAWRGTASQPITLRSSVDGQAWNLVVGPYSSASRVNVKDSNASGGPAMVAATSVDSGNNTNWIFQAAALSAITSGNASIVSPACVEGTSGADAQTIRASINGGTAFDVVRLNPSAWCADNGSSTGTSLGVLLSATQSTHVEIDSTDVDGATSVATQDITWTPTDLKGNTDSSHTVLIRRGDALLLTDTEPGTALWIDSGGGGTPTNFGGAPGALFPCRFNTAGSFLITATVTKADNSHVLNYLIVTVVDANLHSPVPCQLNFARGLNVYVSPVLQTPQVSFISQSPGLALSVVQYTSDGARLSLNPSVRGAPIFLARLGGSTGPILAWEPVKVFEVASLNRVAIAFTVDADGFSHGTLSFQVTPRMVIDNDNPATSEHEGLYFDLRVLGSGFCFDKNPATDFYGTNLTRMRVHSNTQDTNGILTVPVILSPSGSVSCHDIQAVQINSPAEAVGSDLGSNPHINVTAWGGLYLQRHLSKKVNRDGAPNICGDNDIGPKDTEKFRVWDFNPAIDGRWTKEIKVTPTTPYAMEQAFFPVIQLPIPNRWFTVEVDSPDVHKIATAVENSNVMGEPRDEVTTKPGGVTWENNLPITYPMLNVAPNQFFPIVHNYMRLCFPWNATMQSQPNSWDEVGPFTNIPPKSYTDLGFYKGDMIGDMNVRVGIDPSYKPRFPHQHVNSTSRPGGPRSHTTLDDGYLIWTASVANQVLFRNLIRMGAIEAEGKDVERFPDIVGANVMKYSYSSDPANPSTTATAIRTNTPSNATPVKIKFRAAPGETVNVGVSLATAGGQTTNKAWVRLTPDDTLESRNGVVSKVTGYNADGSPILEPIDRVVNFSLTIPQTVSPSDPWQPDTRIVYVYGLEPTSTLDELKLVVWGEERIDNKAAYLIDQDHHHTKTEAQSEEPNPIRRWYVTDEEPLNVVQLQWINHRNRPVNRADEATDDDMRPYLRGIGQPGGISGYGGPHPDTGFQFFEDPFRISNLIINPAGPAGVKTISCDMTSNVSPIPTNGLNNTNSFILTQVASDSVGYSSDNGVLGIMLSNSPTGSPRKSFKALVINPIFGYKDEKTFYETGTGTNVYMTRRVKLVAVLNVFPNSGTIQTMQASLSSDVPGPTGATNVGPITLVETTAASNSFTNLDGSFTVTINRMTNKVDSGPDDFTATVSNTILGVNQTIDAIESGDSTLEFRTDLLANENQKPLTGSNAHAGIGLTYRIQRSEAAQNGPALPENAIGEVCFANPEGAHLDTDYAFTSVDNLTVFEKNKTTWFTFQDGDQAIDSTKAPIVIKAKPGEQVIGWIKQEHSIRTTISIVKVEFLNNLRDGDCVVSAKDDALGLPGGNKVLSVQVTPNTQPVKLIITPKAGATGSAIFKDTDNNIKDGVKDLTEITLLGRDISSKARGMLINAMIGDDIVGTWEFTVFRVDIKGFHDTTDTMNPEASNTATGSFANFWKGQFGDEKCGYLAPGKSPNDPRKSFNRMYVEGKIIPAAMSKDDFMRRETGAGFHFKQTIVNRIYFDGNIQGGDNENKNGGDDSNVETEDDTADPEKRGDDTSLYVYAWDAPGLTGIPNGALIPNGSKRRRRSNFKQFAQYAGVACSSVHVWWEKQSMVNNNGTLERNMDFDQAGDDDDTLAENLNDNNVHYDGVANLTDTGAAPGALDHFRFILPAQLLLAGDKFNITVIAEDANNNVKTDLSATVSLTHNGTQGADGPPKAGVFINGTSTSTDDSAAYTPSDSGIHAFPIIDYSKDNPLNFTATSAAKSSTSDPLNIH